MDKNGNESNTNCTGCKLVCRSCISGYYLKKNNSKCKKIPKNCAKVNLTTGKCTKCQSGYNLNGNACVKNKWFRTLTKKLTNYYRWINKLMMFIHMLFTYLLLFENIWLSIILKISKVTISLSIILKTRKLTVKMNK